MVKLPIQTKGNTQGEVFTLYYQYSDDLKRQGAQYSIPTNAVFDLENQGVIVFRGQLVDTGLAAGTRVGEVKFTWYVRLSSRKYI